MIEIIIAAAVTLLLIAAGKQPKLAPVPVRANRKR
jgi:hypothetical protein